MTIGGLQNLRSRAKEDRMGRRKLMIADALVGMFLKDGWRAVRPVDPARETQVIAARFMDWRIELLVESPDFQGHENATLNDAPAWSVTMRVDDELWLVGELLDGLPSWRVHGVFTTQAIADVACTTDRHFYCQIRLNVPPADLGPISVYPRALEAQSAAGDSESPGDEIAGA